MSEKVKAAIHIGNIIDKDSTVGLAESFCKILKAADDAELEQSAKLEVLKIFKSTVSIDGAQVKDCHFTTE